MAVLVIALHFPKGYYYCLVALVLFIFQPLSMFEADILGAILNQSLKQSLYSSIKQLGFNYCDLSQTYMNLARN